MVHFVLYSYHYCKNEQPSTQRPKAPRPQDQPEETATADQDDVENTLQELKIDKKTSEAHKLSQLDGLVDYSDTDSTSDASSGNDVHPDSKLWIRKEMEKLRRHRSYDAIVNNARRGTSIGTRGWTPSSLPCTGTTLNVGIRSCTCQTG